MPTTEEARIIAENQIRTGQTAQDVRNWDATTQGTYLSIMQGR